MKVRWIFSLLIIAVLPSAAYSNTLYFPQVAFGDGYSTTFVILNTGTTPVSSQIRFYNPNGEDRPDLSTPINIAPGTSTRFTIPDAGPLTVVWGELAAGAGTVQGVATFDLRTPAGVLSTTAGVLGTEGDMSFLLPVDVTAFGSTGIAIANTSGTPLNVALRLIGEDGTPVAAATDVRFNPIAAHGQVADFVTNIFPQLAGSTFKGTLVVEAPPGAPAQALAATALTVKEGILSALPVIPGSRTSSGGTLYFPQVAYGGGYATNFLLMNTGTTPLVSIVNFFDPSGASRPELTQPVNIPPGGSTRFTLPDIGPLTVVWGELAAGNASVRGVASFDLRTSWGALSTTAGVLGSASGNTFLLPVDVTPASDTGVAVANVNEGNAIALRLRLLDENGTEVAAATDPRLTTLGPHGQIADFVANMFPQLRGTTFRGALIVEAGPGAPPNALAATALTVKEQILSAIPVLRAGAADAGAIAGPGAAAACLNTSLFNNANALHLEYAFSGASSGSAVSDVVQSPSVTFEGHNVHEWKGTVFTTLANAPPFVASSASYLRLEGQEILFFGNVINLTTPIPGTAKSVYVPPYPDRRYLLDIGETWTTTYTRQTTTGLVGLPPFSQSASETYSVTYLGRETVTVPAGTFDSCKFLTLNNTTTWEAVGSGIVVRSSIQANDGSITVTELTSGTINGTAIH